ncbi:anthranilate phosphoribosyltransferase [Cryomorphaceae bacterium]|nr:anthranilate phosphoribosyltransferase [Cryomorphaceae bacterium]
MKDTLQYLFEHNTLTQVEAKDLLTEISAEKFDPFQVAAFLTVFRVRGITVQELSGFREALLELASPVDLEAYNPVDLCGTGGDGKDTFNVSTLSSFVTAGAGVRVAKHGNYAVSSSCGSSNVMEYLGYQFTGDEGELQRQIEEVGICFLHAPLFHPAMKAVAPIRRSMGVHTFFNMLGPMVNPARPKRQLVGVYSLELLRLYHYLYQQTDIDYRIVHSLDGYDEISLTSGSKVLSPQSDMVLYPDDFGAETLQPEALHGGQSVKEAAAIFMNILEGSGTDAQNAVVIANSSLAISSANPQKSLQECRVMAQESLTSGNALNVFKRLIKS